jgi:hypothetical protein
MDACRLLVIEDHQSEFPVPLAFQKGATLSVGDIYNGPEGWTDWYFCTCPRQSTGWAPKQVLRFVSPTEAIALEDYTARELSVRVGDVVIGSRMINGWQWCVAEKTKESGWVPVSKLAAVTKPGR